MYDARARFIEATKVMNLLTITITNTREYISCLVFSLESGYIRSEQLLSRAAYLKQAAQFYNFKQIAYYL